MIAHLARFFGFTRNGASILGRHSLRLLGRPGVKRAAGLGLLGFAAVTIVSPAFANIGGGLSLNLDSPPVVIDVSTRQAAQLPMDFLYESRGFSWFHSGTDLVAPVGTLVKPIISGEIIEAGPSNLGYGNFVIVDHDQGYSSLYAHLSQVKTAKGERVDLNSILGSSGNTGWSTGPHLHLEVHYNGVPINPADIVSGVK